MSTRRQAWSEARINEVVGRCISGMFLRGEFLRDFPWAKKVGARVIAELKKRGLTVMPRSLN